MYRNQENFVAIIPARAGSKEIKKKNIIKINGHPLVSYSIEAAKRSKFIKSVFVTTDGKEIAKVAEKYGAKIIFRPKHLSNDTIQIEPAILHAIKYIEEIYREKIDNIVLLQPTSPIRKLDDLDSAIKKFIKNKADSLFSCVNFHSTVWRVKNSKVLPLGHNPFNRRDTNRKYMPETLTENGSIYITKKKIYKTIKNRLGGKILSYTMDSYSAFEVDTKNDLKFFSAFLKPEIRKIFKLINPQKIK